MTFTSGQNILDPVPLIVPKGVAAHLSAPNQLTAYESRDILLGNPQLRTGPSEAGNNKFVDECLYVLDSLGPDAATGRHDLFWAKVRELQPGSISFGNPTYKVASLPDHAAERNVYGLSL